MSIESCYRVLTFKDEDKDIDIEVKLNKIGKCGFRLVSVDNRTYVMELSVDRRPDTGPR